MRLRLPAAALSLFALFGLFALCLASSAQQTVLPLWPHGTPEPPQTSAPETNVPSSDASLGGDRSTYLTNVTVPTLSVYAPPDTPASTHRHAAALVFPGGSYLRLAWNKEGLDTCRWLNSIGLTCLLVKYRVPEQSRYPDNPADLEDAQQAMRLARAHAADWHINPHKIGVIGFSAGAHLAVALSTHWDDTHVESTPAASQINAAIGAHPDFAIVVYPGYLDADATRMSLTPTLTPRPGTPPTFLLQAENDPVHVENSLVYFRALKDAGIPTELHIYATGGHGFGLHPVGTPEEHWTETATVWLRSLNMLPPLESNAASGSFQPPAAPTPCPTQQPPIGRPATTQPNNSADNPACW